MALRKNGWSEADEDILRALYDPSGKQTWSQLTARFNSNAGQRRSSSSIANRVTILGLRGESGPLLSSVLEDGYARLTTRLTQPRWLAFADPHAEKQAKQAEPTQTSSAKAPPALAGTHTALKSVGLRGQKPVDRLGWSANKHVGKAQPVEPTASEVTGSDEDVLMCTTDSVSSCSLIFTVPWVRELGD